MNRTQTIKQLAQSFTLQMKSDGWDDATSAVNEYITELTDKTDEQLAKELSLVTLK